MLLLVLETFVAPRQLLSLSFCFLELFRYTWDSQTTSEDLRRAILSNQRRM